MRLVREAAALCSRHRWQPRERVPAVRRARNVDVVEDAAVHASRSRGGQQVVSIGVLEIISHGSYEAQRHGDWPISMALTTVPELHCGTVKGVACLTNLLTSGVIEHDESRADLGSRWCRSVQAYLKSFPMAPAKHNVTATGRLAWH